MTWKVIHGDSSQHMDEPFPLADAVVSDPPYGIDIAGWDYGVPSAEHWRVIRSWTRVGGILMAFGGARLWHRLACAIEDGGWEIMADSMAWIYGTGFAKGRRCLRPAFEPIVVARNQGGHLLVDDMRAQTGKWPTNVVVDEEIVEALDPRAQRIFYVPKPSVREKEAGCEALPAVEVESLANRLKHDGPRLRHNTHPTVKPIHLMKFLIEASTPPGGLVLDPFCGSGTTGCAAVLAGRSFVGIEKDEKYVEIAQARIAHWEGKRAPA